MINNDLLTLIYPAIFACLLIIFTHAPLGLEVIKRGIIFIDLAVAQIAGLGAQRAGAATGLASLLSGLAGQTGAAQRGTAGALQSGGQQLFSMGTGAGQQLGQAGVQAAQQLSGLAGQLAGGQQQGAQAARVDGQAHSAHQA